MILILMTLKKYFFVNLLILYLKVTLIKIKIYIYILNQKFLFNPTE